MCVILHGLRKKHVRRAEVEESMRTNSSGFFLCAIPHGGRPRRTVRTLDRNEALKFFDGVGDDEEFVMHARIPSYGGKSLQNVHGWTDHGILFMHNMSLRNIDGFRDQFPEWRDRTDSEFFFRKLFIPMYVGYGEEAYRDGKLHPDLDKFVTWICGTSNKFLFVMPDDVVIRYGNWVNEPDRKEPDGRVGFWASNSSYRVFTPAWTPGNGGTARGAGFRGFDDAEFDDYDGYGCWSGPGRDDGPSADRPASDLPSTSISVLGYSGVARAALANYALSSLAYAMGDLAPCIDPKKDYMMVDRLADVADMVIPDMFSDDTASASLDNLYDCDNAVGLDNYVREYAKALDASLCKALDIPPSMAASPSNRSSVVKQYEHLNAQVKAACLMYNLVLDFSAEKAENFATAFVIGRSRTGNPMMKEIKPCDILVPPDYDVVTAYACVEAVLRWARLDESERVKEIEAQAAGTDGPAAAGDGPGKRKEDAP